MTSAKIVLEVANGQSTSPAAQLIEAGNFSSLKVVDLASAGPAWKFAGVHAEMITVGVVSDTQLMEADRFGLVEGSDLAYLAAVQNTMNEVNQTEFSHIANQLVADLPGIQKGLAGELGAVELGELIRTVQSHLLDLNSTANEIFGDLGQEVSQYSELLQAESDGDLIGSSQIDANELAGLESGLFTATLPEGQMPTLEALFTSPENIPTTLDFSDQAHFDSSLDYFSGAASSISSGARDDSGFDPVDGSSSDLS